VTATLTPPRGRDALQARLEALRAQRDLTLTEITPDGSGDAADRATNVDGHVRLAMLEERIIAIETELANANPTATRPAGDTVAIGDLVSVDFGDGPETFLLGSLEQGADEVDVITPGSPLGQALTGAAIGSTVTYATRTNRKLQATIVAVLS
jgi:transcription elongation factor GreA